MELSEVDNSYEELFLVVFVVYKQFLLRKEAVLNQNKISIYFFWFFKNFKVMKLAVKQAKSRPKQPRRYVFQGKFACWTRIWGKKNTISSRKLLKIFDFDNCPSCYAFSRIFQLLINQSTINISIILNRNIFCVFHAPPAVFQHVNMHPFSSCFILI